MQASFTLGLFRAFWHSYSALPRQPVSVWLTDIHRIKSFSHKVCVCTSNLNPKFCVALYIIKLPEPNANIWDGMRWTTNTYSLVFPLPYLQVWQYKLHSNFKSLLWDIILFFPLPQRTNVKAIGKYMARKLRTGMRITNLIPYPNN